MHSTVVWDVTGMCCGRLTLCESLLNTWQQVRLLLEQGVHLGLHLSLHTGHVMREFQCKL